VESLGFEQADPGLELVTNYKSPAKMPEALSVRGGWLPSGQSPRALIKAFSCYSRLAASASASRLLSGNSPHPFLLSKGSQKLFISHRSSKANFPKRVEEGGKEKIRPSFYVWI